MNTSEFHLSKLQMTFYLITTAISYSFKNFKYSRATVIKLSQTYSENFGRISQANKWRPNMALFST